MTPGASLDPSRAELERRDGAPGRLEVIGDIEVFCRELASDTRR